MHDEDAVGHAEHFGQFGADHHDRFSLRGELVHEEVNLVFCADVDAARRFVENQHVAIPREPFREHDLLLIAAGKIARALFLMRDLDFQRVHEAAKFLALATELHEAALRESIEIWQAEVLAHRMPEHEALQFAVFGQKSDPRSDGVARTADREHVSIEANLARFTRIRAEDEPDRFCAARADESGERDDFATPHGEGNIAHRAARAEPAHFQARSADLRGAFWKFILQLAAHHHLDHLVSRELPDGLFADVCAIAEKRDAIRDGENLVEPVADVDHADLLPFEFADDLEKPLHFMGSQRRARLIHDDDARIKRERLRDFHELLLRGGETAARSIEIDFHAEPLEQFRRAPPLFFLRHESRPADFLAEEDVLTRGEAGDEIELLIDDGDARLPRVVRRVKCGRVSVDQDFAFVRAVRAAEHFHQRAFSRAVFAEQRQHFARAQRKTHAAQRLDAGK